MNGEQDLDAFRQELRKTAEELRREAVRLREQEQLEKRASFTVDIKALKELIHGKD